VRDIRSNTRSADNVVQGELADPGVELQEEGERLTDTAGGTEDGDFGGLEGVLVSHWTSFNGLVEG